MGDHKGQQLTPREMVRAHAYPVLAAVSSLSLLAIALQLIPIARQASSFNACVEQTVSNADGNPRGRALATRICNGFNPNPGLN